MDLAPKAAKLAIAAASIAIFTSLDEVHLSRVEATVQSQIGIWLRFKQQPLLIG